MRAKLVEITDEYHSAIENYLRRRRPALPHASNIEVYMRKTLHQMDVKLVASNKHHYTSRNAVVWKGKIVMYRFFRAHNEPH